MYHRSRDNLEKCFPIILRPLENEPSLFFSASQLPSLTIEELEDSLGEQLDIFEEPIAEEEE